MALILKRVLGFKKNPREKIRPDTSCSTILQQPTSEAKKCLSSVPNNRLAHRYRFSSDDKTLTHPPFFSYCSVPPQLQHPVLILLVLFRKSCKPVFPKSRVLRFVLAFFLPVHLPGSVLGDDSPHFLPLVDAADFFCYCRRHG